MMRKSNWNKSHELTLDVLLDEDLRKDMRNSYNDVSSQEIEFYEGSINLGRILKNLKDDPSSGDSIDRGYLLDVLEQEIILQIKTRRAREIADRIHEKFMEIWLDEAIMESLHGDAGDRD